MEQDREKNNDLEGLDLDFDINKDAELEPARMIECENCGEEYDDGSPHKCDDEEVDDIIECYPCHFVGEDDCEHCDELGKVEVEELPEPDHEPSEWEPEGYEPSANWCWIHKYEHEPNESDDCDQEN